MFVGCVISPITKDSEGATIASALLGKKGCHVSERKVGNPQSICHNAPPAYDMLGIETTSGRILCNGSLQCCARPSFRGVIYAVHPSETCCRGIFGYNVMSLLVNMVRGWPSRLSFFRNSSTLLSLKRTHHPKVCFLGTAFCFWAIFVSM